MSDPVRQLSFSGGEVAPAMYARTDHVKYDTGLRTLRNMICMRHGGVTGRPGTEYCGTTLNGGNQVRLIPFIFNETGAGQSYVLEFGDQYISFYQDGSHVVDIDKIIDDANNSNPCRVHTTNNHGFAVNDKIVISEILGETQLNNRTYIVNNIIDPQTFEISNLDGSLVSAVSYGTYVSGGIVQRIYQITSPYLQADIADLQFAESADVLTICHPSYAPRELSRLSATSWTLTAITFGATIQAPTGLGAVGTVAGATSRSYQVTAVAVTGEESLPAQLDLTLIATPTNAAPITLSYVTPPQATQYFRVYYANQGGTSFGFLGTALTTSFIDDGTVTPDFSNAPPISTPVSFLSSADNYPSTVGFIQQRRGFAATNNNPIGFWFSQTGFFSNFNTHLISVDSDAISGSIAGGEVNAIEHIAEQRFALMLTSGAEIYAQGNGSGILTPSAVNAAVQSQYGASSLRPLKVGDVLLFNQALGSFIRDFGFDFAIDGYRGNDITVFSSHLFEGYTIVDWAFQKIPDSIVWAVRSDGVLLSCTYLREQQILAWAHHDFTDATVENICSIPENGNYSVYLSIKRTINGSTVRYIERLSSRIWSDPLTATYLDCFLGYDGRNTTSTTINVDVAGSFETGDTAYQQTLFLTSNLNYFTAAMVGDDIFMQDAEFVSSMGAKGNQVRFTIMGYTNPNVVNVVPSAAVPTSLQRTDTTNWSRAVKTVSGLFHLEGEEVSVWADRFVVASPLNSQITTTYTVANGTITLDKCYAVIYVGLPMKQDIQSLDQETSAGASILSKRKRTGRVNIYTYKSRSMFVGSEDPDTNLENTDEDTLFELVEQMHGTGRLNYDEPSDLGTKQDYVTFDTRWNYGGRIFIRNVDPIPMSILAIAPEGEDPAQSPFYKKV